MARRYLGRDQNMGGYRLVFEIEDGLEVDENSFVEIERTRVYYDDVVGITYHREYSIVFTIAMGLMAALFGGLLLVALFADARPEKAAVITFAILTAPFALLLLLHLMLKVDVITVFGKRTMASMRFPFRKGYARRLYQDLAAKIKARQEKVALALAPPPPPAEPPLPPPPPTAPA